MTDPFTEIAPGVLVATGELYVTTTTVIAGPDGSCLVIDPAVTVDEMLALSASLRTRGLRAAAGWSTHPHWDHLLWHASLGAVPRYATRKAVAAEPGMREDNIAELNQDAPGHDLDLFGQVTALDATEIPWDGPSARVIAHDGHAPGHGAVFLPDTGVLIAGDMCSDLEIPLLDTDAADPLLDYRTGLAKLRDISGVRWVVPGHGHVGDAAEFTDRVAADVAYLDELERGLPFHDPRITTDLQRDWHAMQLAAQTRASQIRATKHEQTRRPEP